MFALTLGSMSARLLPPEDLTHAVVGPNINLSWTLANPSHQTRIYRSVNGGAYALIGTNVAGDSTYTDNPGLYDTNAYRVTHYDGQRESFPSNVVTQTPTESILLDATAEGYADGSCPGTSAVNRIQWTYAGNITGALIDIYLSRDGGAYNLIDSGIAPDTPGGYQHTIDDEYIDLGGGILSSFSYRVDLVDSGGSVANSPFTVATFSRQLSVCGV